MVWTEQELIQNLIKQRRKNNSILNVSFRYIEEIEQVLKITLDESSSF